MKLNGKKMLLQKEHCSKVLFLITELQRPVGGLYRYATELLPAWRDAVNKGEMEYEPLVFSIRDPSLPLIDLRPSPRFQELELRTGFKIYEAVRGGEKCYFLESYLSEQERNAFHNELWDNYRIKSEKSSHNEFYQKLNAFWKHIPIIAEYLVKEKEEDIALVDTQDWLAFPAGFEVKRKLNLPLLCRFHSGEFGRSLGSPDLDDAPARIEVAALQEADFMQGVSIGEAKYEVYKLLPLKQKLSEELAEQRGQEWFSYQQWKEGKLDEFLLLESEDLALITDVAAGIPNGIILDEWKGMSEERIRFGKVVLQKILPYREKYVLFIGRADWRKGIDALIEAFAELKMNDVGLVLSSAFSQEDYRKYAEKIRSLGVEKGVVMYNGWLDEDLKKSLFCACDVIALPSIYEPFGIVMLEALAADLACENNQLVGPVCIVGDTGGMKEVIRNGVSGLKVPMEQDLFKMDPAFLGKMLRIALTNEALHKRISRGGATRVQSRYFDWSYNVLLLREVYKKAIGNGTESSNMLNAHTETRSESRKTLRAVNEKYEN